MRSIVFFDLPTETLEDKRNYRHFRKLLIKNGFLMLQESVYSKLIMNKTVQYSIIELLKKNKPPSGNIFILTITEKQFSSMEFLIGEYHTDIIESDERLIIL